MTGTPAAESAKTVARILGNLDCEADFAAHLGRADGATRQALPRAALETAAALATLLRAFARDDDRLWVPAPVAPQRMAEVPGLPRPALESGPLEPLIPPRQLLAWGETPAAAAHRRRITGTTQPSGLADAPLHQSLWRLPAPDPAVAAAVHHRAFALDLATRLGVALPGARMLASPLELEKHLRGMDPESLENAGRWVLKAPLSAAGRLRTIGSGHPKGRVARRVERLFDRHGPLLFEPWLERTADFGVAGLVDSRNARLVAFHRSLIGRGGAFLGLELDTTFGGIRLGGEERERLETVFDGVARALRQRGYSGPFGIDCWRYRHSTKVFWHPLGEINARMTFGLVARALVDRIRGPAGLGPRATVRLRVSPPVPQGALQILEKPAAGARTTLPLLLPAPKRRAAAWLEIPA